MGGSKTQSGRRFSNKSGIVSKTVCYKLYLCEKFQRQYFKAFTGLSNFAQMVGGDASFYRTFSAKMTPPYKNGDFQLIFARSTSAVRASDGETDGQTHRQTFRSYTAPV